MHLGFLNDDGSFLKVDVCFNESMAYYFGIDGIFVVLV
jgi:hypothetical protein